MKHARLSASGSKRWINCKGSVRREQEAGPQPSSMFGMQGTAAHHLADHCLKSGMDLATDYVGDVLLVKDGADIEHIPAKHVGGKRQERLVAEGYTAFTVTDEEGNGDVTELPAWAINMFIDTVRTKYEALADVGAELVTEVYLDLTWLHPLMGGTADANFMGIDGYIKLFDLKFGSGVTVEVKDNTQLRIYAIGILHLNPEAYGVDMWIVQPRKEHADGPIRHIRYEADELRAFAEELRVAADQTQVEDAPLKAGDHCTFCKGMIGCEEFKAETQRRAVMEFSAPPEPIQAPTDPEELARAAEWIPMLDAYAKAVEGAIARELQQGREVRGFKLVRAKTNRRYGRPDDHPDGLWEKGDKVSEEEIVELMKSEGMLSEKEMYHPRKLLSLAQMEKLGKDAKKAIKSITYKPEGALTVAPISDPREAVRVEPASFPEEDEAMMLPGE